MSVNIHPLQPKDVPSLWRINEEGLPGVGKVSETAIADLLSLAELPLGAFDGSELVGFVLCLVPGTRYACLNYAWFNEHYQKFLYVDRIAISQTHRNRQVGTQLYASVIEYANQRRWPIADQNVPRRRIWSAAGNGIMVTRLCETYI